MKGHIRKRGDTWTAVVYLGRDPQTGKPKRKWSGGHRTKAQAERAARQLITSVEDGSYVEASRATVAEYLGEWLDGLAARGLRPSTCHTYRLLVETLVLPQIGQVPLQKLTAATLNKLYGDLARNGRKNGGPLSLRSVRIVHTILRKSLQDALDGDLLVRNPADKAKPPSASAATSRAMNVWTSEQLAAFLASVEGDRLFPAYFLLARTGLRRGELLGLRWEDVNLDAGRLSVVQTLIAPRNKVQIGEPKTSNGRRSVDLDDGTAAVLREHRKRQLEERLAFGPGYKENGLVFREPTGEPVHPARFTDSFKAAAKRAGVPVIRVHDVRHTHASHGLAAGVPAKVMQERLGHHSAAFTLDRYSHVAEGMQREAAERIAALYGAPAALADGPPERPAPLSEPTK